jgi:hypothetical protein
MILYLFIWAPLVLSFDLYVFNHASIIQSQNHQSYPKGINANIACDTMLGVAGSHASFLKD